MIESLTKREFECLDLISKGRANDEIMKELYISPATLRTHINNIYSKFGLSTGNPAKKSVLRVRAALIYLNEVNKEGENYGK